MRDDSPCAQIMSADFRHEGAGALLLDGEEVSEWIYAAAVLPVGGRRLPLVAHDLFLPLRGIRFYRIGFVRRKKSHGRKPDKLQSPPES